MLNNLLGNLKEYVEKHKELENDMNEQDAKNAKLYNEGVRIQKLGDLKEVYHTSCKILHEQYKEKVEAEFEDAFKQLRTATMQPIDQGVLNNISLMEQMEDISQDEADSLFEVTKNNYLANKKVSQYVARIGKGKPAWKDYMSDLNSDGVHEIYFIPVSSVKDTIEGLQEYIMHNIFANDYKEFTLDKYNIRNILKGDYINDVKSQGDKFINRYMQQ